MRKIGNSTIANATARVNGNSGSSYRDLLDLSSAPWKPEWMDFQDGVEYRFDVIPYVATSAKDPMVFTRKNRVGDIMLTLDVPAHRLGPTFSKVLCPTIYGKPCESCKLRAQGYDTVKAMNIPRSATGKASPEYTAAAEQHVKPWKESNRSICWARPYEKRGTQWFPLTVPKLIESSAAFFSQALYDQLNNMASASSIDVGDVVNGYSVFVKAVKGNMGGVSLEGLSLIQRTVAVPDEMEEMCFPLSEYLVETSSKDIKELCYGAEPDNEAPARAPYVPPAPAQQAPGYTAPAPAYVPPAPTAQPQYQPTEPAYQPSSGPHAYTPPEPAPAPAGMAVDFGDVSELQYGDTCPSGHRFARDVGKKPECGACKYATMCQNVADAD